MRGRLAGFIFAASFAALVVCWIVFHPFAPASGASGSNGLLNPPGLPATQIVPLTRWQPDPHISNLNTRVVKIQGACFAEVVSGDNGLDVQLAPMRCP